MKKNINPRNKAQIVIAALVVIAGSYTWGQITAHKIQTSITSWELFYFLLSSIAALTISWIEANDPWRWILALIVANYLSGYAFIQHWGQLGPFDLIFMAVYSIPCLLIALVVNYMKKLFWKIKGHKIPNKRVERVAETAPLTPELRPRPIL